MDVRRTEMKAFSCNQELPAQSWWTYCYNTTAGLLACHLNPLNWKVIGPLWDHIHVTVQEEDLQSYPLIWVTAGCFPPVSYQKHTMGPTGSAYSLIVSEPQNRTAFGSMEPSAELQATWSWQGQPMALHCSSCNDRPLLSCWDSAGLGLLYFCCTALDWAGWSVHPTTQNREQATGKPLGFPAGNSSQDSSTSLQYRLRSFAVTNSMVCSPENKEECWQCSNAFITFITFTSVTRKLIARYLYSPFPFPPLPALLLRYIPPLWRALGFVSHYLIQLTVCFARERISLFLTLPHPDYTMYLVREFVFEFLWTLLREGSSELVRQSFALLF